MKPCNLDGCTGYSMFDTCDAHSSEKVVFDRGVEAERERIIKIISEWDFPVNQGIYTVDDAIKSLIALIKGEK